MVNSRPKCPDCKMSMQGVYIRMGESSRFQKLDCVWFCRPCQNFVFEEDEEDGEESSSANEQN